MLLSKQEDRIKVRSTKKLNAKGIAKIAEIVGSFESVDRYERTHAPARGRRLYPFAAMITLCIYIEIKGLTYDGDISQNKLGAMGMPKKKGGYLRPSPARISYFLNKEWPELQKEAGREFAESVLAMLPSKEFTVDSTPMEASRYSRKYRYSPHYEIRMAKCHILMCNGYPLVCTFTDANDSDSLELPKLLDMLPDRITGVKQLTSDGAYPSFANYSKAFSRLGVVMASNPAETAVYHEDRSMDYIERLYSSVWKDPDYRPGAAPRKMLGLLIKKGKGEEAGKFLRNLDMARGRRISARYARDRHVCETIHRAMKRWMAFDVRGLRKESEEARKKFKFFTAQILCAVFDPYYQPDARNRI